MSERSDGGSSRGIERVVWNPRYSVRVEELDAQHRELFSIVNRLADLYERGSDDVYPILAELAGYAAAHFHAESMVMSEAGYPAFEAHTRYHGHFVEKIRNFLERYRARDDEDLTYSMLVYCRNWIVFHTTEEDMKYARHLIEKGRT